MDGKELTVEALRAALQEFAKMQHGPLCLQGELTLQVKLTKYDVRYLKRRRRRSTLAQRQGRAACAMSADEYTSLWSKELDRILKGKC